MLRKFRNAAKIFKKFDIQYICIFNLEYGIMNILLTFLFQIFILMESCFVHALSWKKQEIHEIISHNRGSASKWTQSVSKILVGMCNIVIDRSSLHHR
jgi:hypothetical protein